MIEKIEKDNLDVKLPGEGDFLREISDSDKNEFIKKLSKQLNYKVGEREVLNWNEVIEMADSEYISYGAHTVTHPFLMNIPDKQAENEITTSKKQIEKMLGTKIIHFSYPFGNYYKRHVEYVKKAGYKTAVTANLGVNTDITNEFLLYRLPVGDANTVPVLALKACGYWFELNKIKFDWNNKGIEENTRPN
jgi:peptidoglycan/xylan/chitin deacetylase (PgdA/CDA1 family)